MDKTGAMEMTVGTIVTIILLMSALILGLILTKNIFQKDEYHFYQVNCTLESPSDTCNDKIEVNNMSILGYEITPEDIDEGILENYFTKLNNNTWSRGKYLVIYE